MKATWKQTYEMYDTTNNSIKFRARTDGQSRRDMDIGYIYVKRRLWKQWGEPYVIQIGVDPIMPREDDVD